MPTIAPSRERFITDSQGARTAVVLDIEEYERLLNELDEIEAVRAYDAAKASDDERIPFDQAVAEIEAAEKET